MLVHGGRLEEVSAKRNCEIRLFSLFPLVAEHSFFENSKPRTEFGQSTESGCRTQPILVVEAGNAGNDLSGFDVVACSGFCRKDGVIPNLQMSRNADLPG